jgi:hypothetical protein
MACFLSIMQKDRARVNSHVKFVIESPVLSDIFCLTTMYSIILAWNSFCLVNFLLSKTYDEHVRLRKINLKKLINLLTDFERKEKVRKVGLSLSLSLPRFYEIER